MVIPHVRTIGTAISFDGNTGFIRINTTGTYHINWSLVVANDCDCRKDGDILVALEDQSGYIQHALSGSPIDDLDRLRTSCDGERRIHISGHTAVYLKAGSHLRLVNRSGNAIHLRAVQGSSGNCYSASLTITEVG